MIKTVSFDKLAGTTLGNYRLERFIGQSKLGPAFLARADATTTYLLRFLAGPMYAIPKEREVYLEHFQFQANQIAALKHPYILPLIDFGIYRGFPYLISPHIPLRSQSISASQNTTSIGCVAQSMLDIIEGTHGPHYQPLARTCIQQNITVTGDGFGLLNKGYIAGAEEHASLALSQPDATTIMRQHANLMGSIPHKYQPVGGDH
jgi:hypothetical protein